MNKKIILIFLILIISQIVIGATINAITVPEIDDEVLVVYDDGNPDRPLVTGVVYNDSDGDGITDDTEVEANQYRETDFDFTNRATETETTAKKAREIVVVGSKVKDVIRSASTMNKSDLIESVAKKTGLGEDEVQRMNKSELVETLASAPIESEDDLELYATALADSDEQIQKIVINEGVLVEYEQPAKFLGFIDITYTATAEVDKLGRLKVQFPFWLFLTQNNSREIETELQDRLAEDELLANIDLQNILQKQQQTLQTISNVMKAKHDTIKAVLRNVRT